MPPKAQANVLRGHGRPKRSAAGEITSAPVANGSEEKRSRVATVDAVEAPAKLPKKRGRPAKVHQEEPVVISDAPRRGRRSLVAPEVPIEEAKKRVGRPAKKAVLKAPATAPKKPTAHSIKAHVAGAETPAAPRSRGRPARNAAAVDLSRVTGSSRVTKSRSKPAPRTTTKTAAAPRMYPRVRSKLRTRALPAPKVKEHVIAPQPTKRRGRPLKNNTAAVQAPLPNKAPSRKTTKAAVSKPKAPRKKRGYTTIEVPDKFAALVRQYIQELENAGSDLTPVGDEDEAGPHTVAGEDAAEFEDEEEGDMIIEEEVNVTSATANVEVESALASEAKEDQNVGSKGKEWTLPDRLPQNINFVRESAQPAAELDFEMSFQEEETHMDEGIDDVDALVQQGDADIDSPDDDAEVQDYDVVSDTLASA